MNSLGKLVSVPVLNGCIMAAIGATLFSSVGGSTTILGATLPSPVVDFAFGATSSLAADLITDRFLPAVTKDEKLKLLETKIANPLVCGGVFIGLQSLLISGQIPGSYEFLRNFACASGAELGALYSYDVVKQMFSP